MSITGERGPGGLYKIDFNNKNFHFPSVTTILSSLKDPELAELRTKMSESDFAKISKNGADRGSVMHMYLENYAKALIKYKDKDNALLYTQKKTPKDFENMDPKIFEKGRLMFYNIFNSDFTSEFYKPLLIEGLMVSFKYKYAGRTDIIYGNQNDEIILGDYKTCSRVLEYHDNKIIKYKLQLAAYINAFEEMYNKNIKEGVIWLSNVYNCQKIVLTKFEYPIYLEFFKKLVMNYDKNQN
jgi:ATP-dependent exoDNAse (exonuclease V) beta subunit